MTEYTPAKPGEYPMIFPNWYPLISKTSRRVKFSIKINVKMGERFAFVTEGEINLLIDKAVIEKKYALNVFDGKLFLNEMFKYSSSLQHVAKNI